MISVIAFHLGVRRCAGGFVGVDVFFVISGFLITDLLVSNWRATGSWDLRRFWVRRARRLLPALGIVLLAVATVGALSGTQEKAELRPSLIAAATYTSNWWQIISNDAYFAHFGPAPPLQHLWSLAVEEQFYLVWPPLLALLLGCVWRSSLRAAAVAAAAVASAAAMAATYVAGDDPSHIYYGTGTHAFGLLFGAVLALALPMRRLRAPASNRSVMLFDVAGAAGLIAVGVAVTRFAGHDPVVYLGGLSLVTMAAAGIVAAGAAPGLIGRTLGLPPLRWLGERSYGIYLWHLPVLTFCSTRLGARAHTLPWRIAEIAVIVAISAGSWCWIERPIRRDGLCVTVHRWLRAFAGGGRRFVRPVGTAVLVLLLASTAVATVGMARAPAHDPVAMQIASGEHAATVTPAAPPRDGRAGYRDGDEHAATPSGTVAGSRVTAVGDSVMLAAAPQLRRTLPGITIDAKVGRQMGQAIAEVRRLRSTGRLRPVTIVGLGTNGPFTAKQLHRLLRALRGHHVLLVNTYVPKRWQHTVNVALAAATRRNRQVIGIADWHTVAGRHRHLLWQDGVHPRPAGAHVYARMIAGELRADDPDVPSGRRGRD